MTSNSIRARLLASTIIGGAAFAAVSATSAFAQDTSAPQEVVVTGSRIPRPNLTSAEPITTVTQEEFKFEGTTNVETLLNNLPSVSPSATQFSNNGASGTATVDVRGFGCSRTLVLIDGRRMPPGDPQDPCPDLNLIPSSLVNRVDVLTGGAASIYGSDALAGVVNFIMKRNFEGLQIDYQYDIAQHDNDSGAADAVAASAGFTAPKGSTTQGRTDHVTITLGSNTPDGKGNIEAYLGYINQEPVRQAAYDTAYCAIADTTDLGNGFTKHGCSGSSNSAYGKFVGKFYGTLVGTNFVPGPTQTASSLNLSDNPGAPPGNFVSYASAPPGATSRTWNYAPYQYYQRQDTRYQGGYFAHYDLNPHVEAYSDFMFMDDHTTGQLAPSGLFTNNGAINSISCDNPLASAAQLQALCGPAAGTAALSAPITIGYRLQNQPRDYVNQHDSFKMNFGFKGALDDAWSYDAYIQYGKTINTSTTQGDVSKAKIANALNVTPAGACVVGGACVPLNIFQPLSAGISAAAFNYIEEDASVSGYTTEQDASFSMVGLLGKYGIKSPWATDGVGVSFGAEYRRNYIQVAPDAATVSGDLSGAGVGGTPKTAGSTDVYDLYGELKLPLAHDQFLIKDLTADLSYRFSDYNLSGESDTYSASLEYAPISDIRFRGAYAKTARAPNVLELYTPNTLGNGSFGDPCAGATPTATNPLATAANCYNTAKSLQAKGVTLAQFTTQYYGNIDQCSAGQCNTLTGGNKALNPETANTVTLGLVFAPSFFRGFTASVDYWDISIHNAVATLPASGLLSECLADGTSAACNFITRSVTGGGVLYGTDGYVSGQVQNIAGEHKRGFDVAMDYRFRFTDFGLPPLGSMSLNFVGTYLVYDRTSLPGEGTYNCAGLFGVTCGQSDPRWRSKFRATWTTPWKADFSAQWRYIGGVSADVNDLNPILASEPTIIDAKIGSYSYFDLFASYQLRDNLTLRAGVNNVLDKDPPVIDTITYPLTAAAGNTYPALYDPLGRTIFVSLTAKF